MVPPSSVPGRTRPSPASLMGDATTEGGPMESMEQERWARLLDAVRSVNGTPAPEQGAVSVAAERSAERTAGRMAWLAARVVGALAVLAVGAVHLQQYEMLYSAIPTIGTLFILNFVGATVLGLGLLAPLGRLLGRRWGGAAVAVLALAAIGLAATAFAFLTIAEQTPIFGFMEPGYDPPAILASRVAEAVTIVSLAAFVIARFVARRPMGRW